MQFSKQGLFLRLQVDRELCRSRISYPGLSNRLTKPFIARSGSWAAAAANAPPWRLPQPRPAPPADQWMPPQWTWMWGKGGISAIRPLIVCPRPLVLRVRGCPMPCPWSRGSCSVGRVGRVSSRLICTETVALRLLAGPYHRSALGAWTHFRKFTFLQLQFPKGTRAGW